jgi:hypothetical protein
MDLFDTYTWADFIVETIFLGTPTIHFPLVEAINMIFVAIELNYQNKAYKIWIPSHFEFVQNSKK